MALSRDSDGSDEDVGAEPASRQSGKRLRVTEGIVRVFFHRQEAHSRKTPRA